MIFSLCCKVRDREMHQISESATLYLVYYATHRGLNTRTVLLGALTCPGDDDDEAAAAGQLPDEVQMLAESSCVWHQVGRHGGLSLGLLEAAL